jgi:RNA polymerase sigma-70 factor (ECF subfamily)
VSLGAISSGQSASPEATQRLQKIFDENYRLIWRVVRRLGVGADAVDDVTQQVFLVAAERLDDILEGRERAFAFGTALRLVQTMRRRQAREIPLDPELQQASTLPRPDDLTDQKRARELLDRVLDQLPLDLRTVFILFELEGMTTPEIAELHEIPLGTAASRLRRARERFRELVEASMAPRRAVGGAARTSHADSSREAPPRPSGGCSRPE